MGLAIGIGNGILFTSQRGVSSIIPGLLADLCARATYCENNTCTTATLEEIEAVRYTAPVLPTGLLADYPGAAAAYSLRNLIDTTTNVVRVRRSSDNTEQDFSATEITDGTLETFCTLQDGFVTTWYDQSGNSNDAVQATAISQAKIIDNGFLTYINGTTPSLYFEQSERRHYAFTGASYPISFFAVKKGINNTQTYQYTIGTASTRGLRAVNENYANNSPFAVSNLYVNNQLGETNSLQYHSINYCNANGDTILDRIGTSRTSSAYSTGMYITEFIVYPTDQSANRTGIETNINTEYTIY